MANPGVDRIAFPSDPRVQHRYASLNGRTYHYLFAEPKDRKVSVTVFLIHGWPDISAGWRYQIPTLLELGCRVVCPDMMGYGGTEAPKVPPNSLQLYGFKRAADDIAELAKQLGVETIVLGGHDWGGSIIWRTLQYQPQLVKYVFAVCTPYSAPQKTYISTESLVSGVVPQFGYQLHLASPEVEARIKSREDIRKFLHGMYGAAGPNKETIFSPEKGILFENLDKVGKSRYLSDDEIDYYVDQYSRNGLHGGLNWYRTRKMNWEEEQQIQNSKITIPALFVQANRDNVLTPALASRMGRHFTSLTTREVDAGHWALWQCPSEVNQILKGWLTAHVLELKSEL